MEIQEPTDFTIQPERWCGDYHISYEEEYIGLDKDVALDCFNFDLYGDKALKLAKKEPQIEYSHDGIQKETLITYIDTPCFALNRYTITNGVLSLDNAPAVYILLDGEATLSSEESIQKGAYFFLPYAARGTTITAEKAVLIECLPSKQA